MANDRLKELLSKPLKELTEDEEKELKDLVCAVAGIEINPPGEGAAPPEKEEKEEGQ